MEQTKKSNKKLLIGGIVLAAIVVLFAVCYAFFSPKASKGAKEIVIEVVDDAGAVTKYEVNTDAEYLRQAMDEAEGLTYEGTESDYGMMIETINGLYADYAENGAYWSIYVDGEYGQYGVDAQPVVDGGNYQFVYTVTEE